MAERSKLTPLASALGITFAASLAASPAALADENPFSVTEMSSGYMVAGDAKKDGEGKCGEGKCGEDKADKEGKCGEGKCGEGKSDKADKEGKCGEGKCGG